MTTQSDSTGSTPDIFKSPERVTEEIVVEEVADVEELADVVADVVADKNRRFTYTGVTRVEETEEQHKDSSDSEDGIPLTTLLRQEKGKKLTQQQIQDCKEGPMGEKAVGVTIAKTFDGVQFRGTIDSFRQARKRFYYHVTYTDGDEEELSQRELRDCYLLGLSDEIETQWRQFKGAQQGKNEEETNDNSEDDCSESEGSQYGNLDFNEEVRHKRKERKEENSRVSKKKKPEMSGFVLPQSGDKTVAAEAYGKLDEQQKKLVAGKVNRKTKKVVYLSQVIYDSQ